MGTRPEIIKMAPVYLELLKSDMQPVVVHTGQHDEMAWPVFKLFGMEPDHVIDLGRERPGLGHLGGKLLDSIESVLEAGKPDAVLVHGDTSTSLMAALSAFYQKIPVGHVEAGLRSGNSLDPFPEEQNRILIARLADWHFAPTQRAADNLVAEAPATSGIHVVGNTIVDAVKIGLEKTKQLYAGTNGHVPCEIESIIGSLPPQAKLILVTGHRRESWGAPLERVAKSVRKLARSHEDLHIVWPVHLNPTVHDSVHRILDSPELASVRDRIHLTAPLDYHQMLWTMRHAWLAITDSGGIQEEAATLGLPVLVTRNTTERPELIEAGGGHLVGTDRELIENWVETLLSDINSYNSMRHICNPYGDGTAAAQIEYILTRDLLGETGYIPADHLAA